MGLELNEGLSSEELALGESSVGLEEGREAGLGGVEGKVGHEQLGLASVGIVNILSSRLGLGHGHVVGSR